MNATHSSRLTSRLQRQRVEIFLPTLCLLLAMAAGLWNVPVLLTDISHLAQPHAEKHVHSLSSTANAAFSVPKEYQAGITSTARQYMIALLNHQYPAMWALLHPRVQAMWPGEAAFANYWRGRFQDYTFQRFVLGAVRWLPYWVNPETMITYNRVLEVPISLQLQPDQTIQLHPLAPPEDLHPDRLFQNLPFIVQPITNQNTGRAKGEKLRWLILDGGPADLETPILPPLVAVSKVLQVPILMYHHISNFVPPTALGMNLTVTPARFGEQLDHLKQRGYSTITFNQLFDALYYRGPLPPHPLILTFDDGYDDAYEYAYPMLKAHGFSGTFYIITGKVGWAGYLNWEQLRTMFAEGMQVGSHTIHHVDMGSLLMYSEALAQQELQKSQAILQNHLGGAIQQFCYPSGEPFNHGSLAARREIVTLLAADGYVGATTDPGMTGTFQSADAPFVLLRVRVDGRSTLQFFIDRLPW